LDYSKLFIFSGLDDKSIKNISLTFPKAQTFKKGEIIYSADTFKNAIGFVINGSVVAVANNHNEVLLKNFAPNMCFGVAAIFGGGDNYVSTITAKTDCEILFLSEEHLKTIFSEYPQVAINYITFISDKIRFLNEKLRVISCMSAEDTLMTYFSSVSDADGYANIPDNMTRFAKTLGLSRATLYRALDILEKNGSILKENNKLKVIKNEKTN
jgi:CRP-like cAMP-binding protein